MEGPTENARKKCWLISGSVEGSPACLDEKAKEEGGRPSDIDCMVGLHGVVVVVSPLPFPNVKVLLY